MKKLIPLIAVALAMVLPAVMSAQTPDYYGYDNSTKTVLIEWVEDAINDGNITFNPTGAEDAFLALVEDLYDYRDAENWSACVTTAGYLETAAQYIQGSAIRSYVESCCDVTGWFYGISDVMCMTGATHDAIQYSLVAANPGDYLVAPDSAHCGGCDSYGKFHFAECTTIYFPKEEEK